MSLQSAMQAAKDAAATTDVATVDQNNGSVVQYGTGLDDFLTSNMQVDSWIQVKDAGIKLNRDERAFIDEFEGELDLDSIQLFVGLRAEFAGNQVEYRQSTDGGKTTTKGENFGAILAKWKETSVKDVSPYRGANMTIILTEDVVQGKTTIPAGTKIGYTTPVTGFYPFQALLKNLAADGKVQDVGGGRVSGGRVKVRFTHEAKQNKQKQEYGVLNMEAID
jgi:predicted NUDIX family NTP pyrophosphohydrolase